MSQDCFSIEELGDLLDLGSDDPRWDHVHNCARCRNLIAALREFEAPTELPAEADVPGAEQHLKHFITVNVDRPEPASSLGGFFRRLIGPERPLLRPVTGLALAVLGLVIILGVRERLNRSDSFVVRDGRIDSGPELILHPPAYQADGSLRLSWGRLAPDATYQVVFYTSRLDEIARYSVGFDTSLVISPADIGSGGFLWQIEAETSGKTIATSQPAGIPHP